MLHQTKLQTVFFLKSGHEVVVQIFKVEPDEHFLLRRSTEFTPKSKAGGNSKAEASDIFFK